MPINTDFKALIHTPIMVINKGFNNKGGKKKRKNGSDFEVVADCKQRVQVGGNEHYFTSSCQAYVSIISLHILQDCNASL